MTHVAAIVFPAKAGREIPEPRYSASDVKRQAERELKDYHINLFYSEEDGGWIADLPNFQYCSAFGDTPVRAVEEIQVAKRGWLEVAEEDGKAAPEARYCSMK